jgi:hypothetical protein
MLPIFNTTSPALLKKKAKEAFDQVSELESDSRNARSMRARAGVMARAFIDKSFIDGAEKMAIFQDVAMACLAQGQPIPDEPTASVFQQVETAAGKLVWVYLPEEYAQSAFHLGGRYQRMDITAQQAIEGTQNLLDQICRYEFKLDEPLSALQFLRDEIAEGDGNDAGVVADGPETQG